MTDWSMIDACSPRSRDDGIRRKLEAIVSVAETYIKVYTGPGDEEEVALSAIYTLACSALNEIPDSKKEKSNG